MNYEQMWADPIRGAFLSSLLQIVKDFFLHDDVSNSPRLGAHSLV